MPSHRTCLHNHRTHSMRRVPRMGNQEVQLVSGKIAVRRRYSIHLRASVGVGPPLMAISPGPCGSLSGMGSRAAIFARMSTSLLRQICSHSTALVASDSSLWLAIHSRTTHFYDVLAQTLRRMSMSEHSLWGGSVAHWVTALLSMCCRSPSRATAVPIAPPTSLALCDCCGPRAMIRSGPFVTPAPAAR